MIWLSGSPQARIDRYRLLCNHATVVGGQEQHCSSYLHAEQDLVDELALHHLLDRRLGPVPKLPLTFGNNCTGFDSIDADIVGAVSAGKCESETDYRSLRRGI